MYFGLGMPFLGTAVGACAALGVPMGSRRWNAALSGGAAVDIPAVIITAALIAIMIGWPKLTGKKLSPIALIVCAAALGVVVFGI